MTKSEFWKHKSLHELTEGEWESLCDGCGKCCLNKLEDYDTGEIFWTNIGCELLDCTTCRCKNYEKRFELVPDCIQLTPDNVSTISWLPPTCAYRLVHEGKDLPSWHHLKSGSHDSVHHAGASIKDRSIEENGITPEEFEDFIVTWPSEPVSN